MKLTNSNGGCGFKLLWTSLVTVVVLGLCGSRLSAVSGDKAAEKTPEKGSKAELAKAQDWSFVADPSLPNVLILGDSISIGYTLEVRELLKGRANVYRPLSKDGKKAENCSGTTYGIANLERWLGDKKWDVIHFNWGLHDLKHVKEAGGNEVSNSPTDPVQATVEVYSRNLEGIVEKLKGTVARLVYATTTPVVPDTKGPLREPEAPVKYNAAAVKIMNERGVVVDDLFAFCEPQLAQLQLPQNVHFSAEGSRALAKQVALAIEAQLKAAGK